MPLKAPLGRPRAQAVDWIGLCAALLGPGCFLTPEPETPIGTGGNRWTGRWVGLGGTECDDGAAGFPRLREEAAARGIVVPAPTRDGPQPERSVGLGVAARDLDGDGDVDLLFAESAGPARLFENDGTGAFSAVETTGNAAAAPAAPSAGWLVLHDLDGDDLPELLTLQHHRVTVSENLGALRFGPARLAWVADDDEVAAMRALAFAGLDEFGRPSFEAPAGDAVALLGEPPPAWLPGTRFGVVPGQLVAGAGTVGAGGRELAGGAVDLDGDQRVELLWLPDGPLGGARAVRWTGGTSGMVPGEAHEGAHLRAMDVADLDADGEPDLCVVGASMVRCVDPLDGADIGGLQAPPLGPGAIWAGAGIDAADLDGDGILDLAISAGRPPYEDPQDERFDTHPSLVFAGRASGFERIEAIEGAGDLPPDAAASLVADLDGDGAGEWIVRPWDGPVRVYWNRCGELPWLTVRLAGPAGNSDGIGAQVIVQSEGVQRNVHITGPRGLVDAGPERTVRLPGGTQADVRVLWPDGSETLHAGVPLGQRVRLFHESRRYGDAATPPWSWFEGGALDEDAGGDDLPSGLHGRLEGTVRRTVDGPGDERGLLYITLFDESPVTNPDSPVAFTIFEADLSAADAEISYVLEEVPTREEPWYLAAFLDDDGDAGLGGPDSGDLMTFAPEMQVWTVAVPDEGTHSFDIELNSLMP